MADQVDVSRSDRRRDWGLLFLAGGGIAMTAYAGYALWLVKDRADFAFYLGAGALFLVAIVLTGFAGLIVKRTIRVNGPGGIGGEISDQGGDQ